MEIRVGKKRDNQTSTQSLYFGLSSRKTRRSHLDKPVIVWVKSRSVGKLAANINYNLSSILMLF